MPTDRFPYGKPARLGCLLAVLWLGGSTIAGHKTGLEALPAPTPVTLAAATIKAMPPQPGNSIPETLTGRAFQWQYSLTEDGDRLQPTDPHRYQLRFAGNNRISLTADCNQYAASLRMTDIVFTTGPMMGTRALCPRGSLEREYIALIEAASRWQLVGRVLMLRLPHDGGIMHFEEIEQGD